MALEVRRRRIGSGERAVEIVDIVGRLDAPGSALLRSAVQEALKEGSPRVAINLSDCIEIHRETVGTLHSLGRACKRAGGHLAVFGAKGDVYEYIKTFSDRSLAPWFDSERDAVTGLGGDIKPEPQPGEAVEKEPDLVVALGTDRVFRTLFWKLGKLGGRPVAKFDNIGAAADYITRRKVHSVIVDISLPPHDVAGFIRRLKMSKETRGIGIFLVGPPSVRSVGWILAGEGADKFVPYVFSGEEISSKLEARAFFQRLKEAYDRFDAGPRGDSA